MLFDELDAIWYKCGGDDTHEELRALLNAGSKRGATIPRCVGPQHHVKQFPIFCAAALAGLGDMPETIVSRAVIVRMRRRTAAETVEPYRPRTNEPEGHELRDRLAAWASARKAAIRQCLAEYAGSGDGSAAEAWEPLLQVADVAGGEWPQHGREACVARRFASRRRTPALAWEFGSWRI